MFLAVCNKPVNTSVKKMRWNNDRMLGIIFGSHTKSFGISRSANGRANGWSGPPVAIIVLHEHDLILWLGDLGKALGPRWAVRNCKYLLWCDVNWGMGTLTSGTTIDSLQRSWGCIMTIRTKLRTGFPIHSRLRKNSWGKKARRKKSWEISDVNNPAKGKVPQGHLQTQKMTRFLAIDLILHKKED